MSVNNNGEPVTYKRWRHGLTGCLALALVASMATSVRAADLIESPPPQPSAAVNPETPDTATGVDKTDQMVESTRRTVRSAVEWLASGVDSWFGDKPFSEGGKVTQGELGLSLQKREDKSASFGVRFKARFRLPNLESYQYLFVGSDDQREVITDQPDSLSRQQLLRSKDVDNSFFAGFGMSLREAVDLRVGFRGGLKPYAQARYRRPWQLGPDDLVEFRETLFFTFDDRLGSTTALSYQHAFSSTLAVRWLNAATITQESQRLSWSSSLGAYQSFGEHRVLSLEALLTGVKGEPVAVTEYGLQAKWEQPIHKDTLIGEVMVGHFWPRPDPLANRGRAWALGGAVKMKF